MLAVEVDRLREKLSMVKTEALMETIAYRVTYVDVPVVEEENVGNTLAEVECKAVLETLAAKETDVKVHTLGDTLPELKVMQRLHSLNDTVGENDGVSLGDTQVEINFKALDYEMTNNEEEIKLEIFGDTRQRRKKCPCKHTC